MGCEMATESSKLGGGAMPLDADHGLLEHWTDREVDESVFKDARLGRRFHELLKQMGGGMGESIPLACQDWANTKAAYRFFANERVSEGDILSVLWPVMAPSALPYALELLRVPIQQG